uniref:Uncharacterized protein n=1 Tax=Leptobrachium leishanense TaxID=445787 RepID=A0A8C5LTJ5_9ANUR
MGSEEELLKIGRKLEKRVNGESKDHIVDLLKELQRFQMTVPLLRSTRIGVTVNKLKKKSKDREVGELAKDIIKAWKKLFDSSYKERGTTSNTQSGTSSHVDLGRFHTLPQKRLHSEKPRGCPDNFLKPDNQLLDPKDAQLKRRHSADVESTQRTNKQERRLSLSTSVSASSISKSSCGTKDERRQSLGSPTLTTNKTLTKPITDTKNERQSLGSPTLTPNKATTKKAVDVKEERQSFGSPTLTSTKTPIKKTSDTKEERRQPRGSPTLSPTKTPVMQTVETKEERRQSRGTSIQSPTKTPAKQTTETKEERRKNLGSTNLATTNTSPKPVVDTKDERIQSLGSPSLTPTKTPIKSTTDTKKERRQTLSSPTHTSSKPVMEHREERRHSLGSPNQSQNDFTKVATDIKDERRHSIGSSQKAAHNESNKSEADSKDERNSGGMSSPLSDCSTTPCFLFSCYQTGDSVRDKCVEMISAALKIDDDFKLFGANCDRLAFEIEENIYNEIKATDMKYRNRVRSRISNLKDPKNPNLRKNVLCGVVTAHKIATMTAEEMASDELRELRNTLTKEAIREHQMAKTSGTQTDLLQCDKCKKKNCTYNQVQTRSADEPMTTFVLCNECGNRWKFC